MLRSTLRAGAEHYQRIQSNIADTLEGQQIARRDDDYSGVTGALLRAYESRSYKEFGEDCKEGDCETISALWQVFKALHDAAMSPTTDESARHVAEAEATIHRVTRDFDAASWRAEVERLVSQLQLDYGALRLLGPPRLASAQLADDSTSVDLARDEAGVAGEPHQMDYGPKGRDENDDRYLRTTRLSTPSLVWPSSAGSPPPRIWQAAELSLLLEYAISPLLPLGGDPLDHKSPRLVQAYFLSLDDVLRIWARPKTTLATLNRFPPLRRWASEEYVSVFTHLPRRDEYLSPPYIDFGGHGVVRSWCHPLETSVSEAKLTGVLCTDYTVPIPHLQEYWARSSLLVDVHYVRLPASLDHLTQDQVCVSATYPAECSAAAQASGSLPTSGPFFDVEATQFGLAELVHAQLSKYGNSAEAADALSRATSLVYVPGPDLSHRDIEEKAFMVRSGGMPKGNSPEFSSVRFRAFRRPPFFSLSSRASRPSSSFSPPS